MKQNTVEANVIWSHTYMPPTFELLRMSEKSKRIKLGREEHEFPAYFQKSSIRLNFHDLAGKDINDVRLEILALATRSKLKRNVENFIVLPSYLFEELEEILDNQVSHIQANQHRTRIPEAPSSLSGRRARPDCDLSWPERFLR